MSRRVAHIVSVILCALRLIPNLLYNGRKHANERCLLSQDTCRPRRRDCENNVIAGVVFRGRLAGDDSNSRRAHIPTVDIYLCSDFGYPAGLFSNYMSAEMFPFPRHVIIAQGNKLFHARGDGVRVDLSHSGSREPRDPG